MNLGDKRKYSKWRRRQVGDSKYNAKVFMTYGRESGSLDLHVSHMGRTSVQHMETYFVPGKFADVTVYSDRHISYKSFFKSREIPYEMFLAKYHVNPEKPDVHNQTVNAYTKNFKSFVNEHLRGVSTKYLELYAKWFQFVTESRSRILAGEKLKFNIIDGICDQAVSDRSGAELYKQSELTFQKFLKNNGRTDFGDCKNHYYADKMAA